MPNNKTKTRNAGEDTFTQRTGGRQSRTERNKPQAQNIIKTISWRREGIKNTEWEKKRGSDGKKAKATGKETTGTEGAIMAKIETRELIVGTRLKTKEIRWGTMLKMHRQEPNTQTKLNREYRELIIREDIEYEDDATILIEKTHTNRCARGWAIMIA